MQNSDSIETTPQQPSGTRGQHRRGRFLRKTRRWLRKNTRLLVSLLLLLVAFAIVAQIVLITLSVSQLRRHYADMNLVLVDLNQPLTQFSTADVERLSFSVSQLERSLAQLKARSTLIENFRGVNGDLDTGFTLLDAAHDMSFAVEQMLAGFEPTLNYVLDIRTESPTAETDFSVERMIELLTFGQSSFQAADDYLADVTVALDQLDTTTISPDILFAVEDLRSFHEQALQLNDLLLQMPDLLTVVLGLEEEQNYLILVQNNDEIRPSGGYVGTFGWLVVEDGAVTRYDYFPTTATSPNRADNPGNGTEADIVDVPDWWLQFQDPTLVAWDSSWQADFAEAAALAKWYYDAGDNPGSPVDGVIAIDIVGFEYLLGALGQVNMPAYNTVVTPQNFREVVYDLRAETTRDELAHKEFLAQLYTQILDDVSVIGRDQEQSSALLGALLRALDEKHVLVYFDDAETNAMLRGLGWSGEQTPAVAHDYVMVVDANVGGNKVGRAVTRGTTYDVVIQPDGGLQSRLAVTYDYPSAPAESDPGVAQNLRRTTFANLMQWFVPIDAVLGSVDNFTTAVAANATEAHTVISSYTTVDLNQSRRLQIEYVTPPLVEQFGAYQRYRLLVQKQPGIINENIEVQVTLPEGATLVSATPQPDDQYQLEQSVLVFRRNVRTDEWFEVIYQLPQ